MNDIKRKDNKDAVTTIPFAYIFFSRQNM